MSRSDDRARAAARRGALNRSRRALQRGAFDVRATGRWAVELAQALAGDTPHPLDRTPKQLRRDVSERLHVAEARSNGDRHAVLRANGGRRLGNVINPVW